LLKLLKVTFLLHQLSLFAYLVLFYLCNKLVLSLKHLVQLALKAAALAIPLLFLLSLEFFFGAELSRAFFDLLLLLLNRSLLRLHTLL
jgi:hypothetical protein